MRGTGSRRGAGGLTLLSRALDVLLAFDGHGEMAPRELAQRLGEARTSLHRYLNVLMAQQLVVRLPNRRYGLGPGVLELSRSLRREIDWVELALPVLRQLAADTGETVLLTAVRHGEVVCLERVGGRHGLAISYQKAGRFPLHAGAPSKVLLAYQPAEVIERVLAHPLSAFTANTCTDPPRLRTELERIRASGIAVADSELDHGVCGVAAPIFDPYGRAAAAVTVAAPAARVGPEHLEAVMAAVRGVAQTISQFIC